MEEKLVNKDENENKLDQKKLIEIKKRPKIKYTGSNPLIINGIKIDTLFKNNYINARQLCKIGGKKFSEWYLFVFNYEKILVEEFEKITNYKIWDLIYFNENYNDKSDDEWLHPYVALHVIHWSSPSFILELFKWIDQQEDNQLKIELEEKDKEIQLIKNIYCKKQKRKIYPENNVIYILTTSDNEEKRIYIVGKAKILTNRLSTYNKTCEHKVVYYKSCKNEEDLHAAETMVLTKLRSYRQQANRDRFILPVGKDISFFTDIIEKSIAFLDLKV